MHMFIYMYIYIYIHTEVGRHAWGPEGRRKAPERRARRAGAAREQRSGKNSNNSFIPMKETI